MHPFRVLLFEVFTINWDGVFLEASYTEAPAGPSKNPEQPLKSGSTLMAGYGSEQFGSRAPSQKLGQLNTDVQSAAVSSVSVTDP